MKHITYYFLICIVCLFQACKQAKLSEKTACVEKEETTQDSVKLIVRNDFQKIIHNEQVQGSIVIFDTENNTFYANDFEWAETNRPPASTYKIIHSLIGLETKHITDENYSFKWKGERRANPEWQKDLKLSEAFQLSCVPCYQELAKKIGSETMNAYLKKLPYGRMKVDDENIDTFWFEEESLINQFQQIHFLRKLYHNKLPVAVVHQEIVKKIMILEDTVDYKLSGKTGRTVINEIPNGWFVGYYETKEKNQLYFFATNINPTKKVYDTNFYETIKKITMEALRKVNPD